MSSFNTDPLNTGDFNGPSPAAPAFPSPGPGTGPYNNPQITISAPLQPPPQQFTNIPSLLRANLAGVMVFRNGLLQTYGRDYTRFGSIITFTVTPQPTDVLTAVVFQIGQQLGGVSPQRYIAPQTFPLTVMRPAVARLAHTPGAGLPGNIIPGFDPPVPAVTYEIETGPTISGVCDGVNKLFTVGLVCSRFQVFRNGILQTCGLDYGAGSNAIAFMPSSIPQPGDLLTFLGYPV